MQAPRISIIVCTRNRSASMARTLEALRQLTIPTDWQLELIVVDNASTDNTKEVVASANLPRFAVRWVEEAAKGKSFALNKGIAASTGEVLLFTDDDIIPAPDWLEALARPLLANECDAVAGRIDLAEHLQRPWLKGSYARWLAVTGEEPEEGFELIGANMGIRREVLTKVPGYDEELAPGAIGLGEDTLFTWQMAEAGLRIKFAKEARVIHAAEPWRLTRASWLNMARSHGRKDAYLHYHWLHEDPNHSRLHEFYLRVKLALRRLLQPPPLLEDEGCSAWEMSYVGQIEMCKQYRIERRGPRKYSRTKPALNSTR
ncbi:MAG: glycosyltransferase [Limisphaerales bacterium]